MDTYLNNTYTYLMQQNKIYNIDILPIEHHDWFDAMLYKYYIEIKNKIEIDNLYKWIYADQNRYGFIKYFLNVMTQDIKLIFLTGMLEYSKT